MTRTFLFLSMPLILLFTVALAVIRAQPYDDYELRELLLPKDCPAPCFMGIRPGVTTVREAVKLLEGSEWVSGITRHHSAGSISGEVIWSWSQLAPKPVNHKSDGEIFWLSSAQRRSLVESIAFDFDVTVGEIYLLLGEPHVTFSNVLKEGATVVGGVYFGRSILVSATLYCPISKVRFWESDAFISIVDRGTLNMMTDFRPIDYWC